MRTRTQAPAGAAGMATAAALLALLPASELAVLLVQRIVAALVPPRRLPRLDLGEGIPENARTMVVVPVLLGSVGEVERLLAHLEVQALGNLDPRIHFAVLSDFKDARTLSVAGDDEILTAAVAGIEALNRRHAPDGNDRFYLFHRDRQWNPKEGVFMGWERKRGKIEELNRLLRSSTDTGFSVKVGDLSILPSVRYVLTLDADTRLPRGAAKTLIGIISHPLNRPVVDAALRRVTEGYGILQPRVSVNLASAAGSLFARVYAGHTGVDPYTTAVSDTYQDLFGEGIFTGKGLYDVDAFQATVGWRVPENALLSHDLFEGLHARTALVSDVEVVDDYPANVLAHARRQHRWVRGDWQILAWLFPLVPTPQGFVKNRLPLISQWKILDNLRRSLVAPSLLAFFGAAWTLLPGSPLVWTLGGLAVVAFPFVASLFHLLEPRPAHEPARVHLRGLVEDLSTAFAQALLTLVFLPFHAWEMVHAIALTLVRLVITQRRLLDWETAATQAARAAGLLREGIRSFFVEMAASPIAALGLLALTIAARPGALPLALPFLALWAAAPACAYWLSQPIVPRRRELSPEDRDLLMEVARKTWHYFETLAGPEDHWLPPDNFQEERAPTVAHRTSPTNIGMGLLVHARGARSWPADGGRDGREARPDADHGRRAGAPRGAPPELVRHAEPLAAPPALRVHGGQRQPRGGASRPGGRVPAAGRVATGSGTPPVRRCPSRSGPGGRDELRFPLRPPASALLDRLSHGRRRRAGASGHRLLRPPGLGVAPGELLRHRQGRRPAKPLVPPRDGSSSAWKASRRSSRGARRCSST